METWKEFQKAIIDVYGNLFGYVGQELTKALRLWLEQKRVGVPSAEVPVKGRTVKQMIREAITALGGEASIQEVAGYIREKHGLVRISSISTDMSDLAINGPPSSLYPMEERFLERVSRGRYRLFTRGTE